jgi:anti-anti-sigma factor
MAVAAQVLPERSAVDHVPAGVGAYLVGNGLVVRLSGVLDAQAVPDLRSTLLTQLPDECREVLVDAGCVVAVDDEALSVLVAGASWVSGAGRRFALCSASPAIERLVDELGLTADLPRLSELG